MDGWRHLVLLLCILVFPEWTFADINPTDVYSCNTELFLECPADHVVATEIYTLSTSCPATGPGCACANASRECLISPLFQRIHISNCLWQQQNCVIQLMPIIEPCYVAKHFHCVPVSDIVDICEMTSSVITRESGYITSPDYPVFGGGLNCPITIFLPSGKSVYVRIISSHLPPDCNEPDKRMDYLKIETELDGLSLEYYFCGNVDFSINRSWLLSGVVTFTFVSRPSAKTYEGFVMYYELVDSPITRTTTTIPASPAYTINSGTKQYENVLGLASVLLWSAINQLIITILEQ